MKGYYYKLIIILLGLIFFSTPIVKVNAKVDPPNYDFSIDALNLFMPSQSKNVIEKKYGDGSFISRKGNYQTKKYYVTHIRYRFAIFVQYKQDKVVDFHASLPTYFLHDIFHQSLINRIGKQDKYHNTSEQSVYIWKNKKGNRHVYAGACTITCFPLYYAVYPSESIDGHKPIIKMLGKY